MITEASEILDIAKVYAIANGLDIKTVSFRCFDDSKKLGAIELGGDLTLTRAKAALQWFSDHWPASAEWPSDIARPVPSKEEARA